MGPYFQRGMSLKARVWVDHCRIVSDMNETQLETVAQLRAFFNGTRAVEFQPIGENSLRYEHIASVLRRFGYRRLKRPDNGVVVVLRYLERTTGYSRQQLTRLVRRGLEGEVLAKRGRSPRAGRARHHGVQRRSASAGPRRLSLGQSPYRPGNRCGLGPLSGGSCIGRDGRRARVMNGPGRTAFRAGDRRVSRRRPSPSRGAR